MSVQRRSGTMIVGKPLSILARRQNRNIELALGGFAREFVAFPPAWNFAFPGRERPQIERSLCVAAIKRRRRRESRPRSRPDIE